MTRAEEKQASRVADALDIAEGRATVEEVRERNALIPAEWCRGPIDWAKNKHIRF